MTRISDEARAVAVASLVQARAAILGVVERDPAALRNGLANIEGMQVGEGLRLERRRRYRLRLSAFRDAKGVLGRGNQQGLRVPIYNRFWAMHETASREWRSFQS